MNWQLADAKNRFSELVNLALSEGPQRVTRRNQAVVVVSESEFQKLSRKAPSFKKYLSQGPSFEGIDIARDKAPGRKVKL